MPLSSNWSAFSPGDTFSESEIIQRFRAMEYWFNGRITSADLKEDPWVESRHIFKPEFYGSPSPRVEAVSGDTHYRYRPFNIESRYYRHEASGWYKANGRNAHEDDSDEKLIFPLDPKTELNDATIENPQDLFVPVEGLAASIHLDHPSLVTVNANWYAWESGGDSGYSGQGYRNQALNDRVALFRLMRKSPDVGTGDPVSVNYTTRVLYGRSDTGYFFRRQNFSVTYMREFAAGTHHIWIGCLYLMKDISGDGYTKLGDEGTGHRLKHVYVDGRNFVLDATRLYRSE